MKLLEVINHKLLLKIFTKKN